MKIAINKCYGGFALSKLGYAKYLELKGRECYFYKTIYEPQGKYHYQKVNMNDLTDAESFHVSDKDLGETPKDIPNASYIYLRDSEIRTDPDMIRTIEELGKAASSNLSNIIIVEIPDDVEWELDDYDGIETVHEKHRRW